MGIFSKTAEYLKERLGKTREKISSSLTTILSIGRKIDDALLDELEETLISDDLGVETTERLIAELREAYRARQISARVSGCVNRWIPWGLFLARLWPSA